MTHRCSLSAPRPFTTILLFTLLPIVNAAAQTPQQQALDTIGFQRDRSYFSPEPWEHYDTVSGNVMLTFTDLTLPGNAGR
jgi:hypothetical protein